jgi:raffinose/stachyose/melibiose transport system substrate-binding protein
VERKTFLASGLTVAAAAALPNLGNLGRVSAASSQSTVTWWSWASVALNPALTPAPGVSHNSTNDALKVLYEKAFPGRKIDDTTYPYPDYLTALKTAFAGGNEPDTLMLQPGALMSEYQPYLLPLESYCTKTWGHNYRKQFAPLGIRETLNADPAHKTLYGLPIGLFGGDAVFYNKAIFKQYNLGIPQSYADLKSIADTLNGHGIIPIAWGAKDGWPNVDWFLMVVEQTAPGIWDAAQHGKAPFTHRGIVQALEILVKMQKDRIFSRNAWGTTAYPEAITLFESGKAAMYLTGSWDIPGFAAPTTKVRNSISLFPLPPLGPGLKRGKLFGGINGALAVSKAAKDPQAAFDFISWQAGPAGLKQTWVDRAYYLPTRTDVAPVKLAPQWAAQQNYFAKGLRTAIDREPLSAVVKQALQDAVANVSVMGQDAAKAAAAIQAAYDKSKK